jgi:outer membrane protein OmpA-like peptidoglycan-associated protein
MTAYLSPLWRKRVNGLMAALLVSASHMAMGQGLVDRASADDLIDLLGGNARGSLLAQKFNYKPTPAPDAGTGRCHLQLDAPRSAGTPSGTRLAVVAPSDDAVYVAEEESPGKLDMQINFRTGSDQIQASSLELLNNLATALKSPALAQSMVAVVGHTDAQGDQTSEGRRKNLELSCARAIAVRQYLIQQGVDGKRLGVFGFGSAKPLQQGATNSELNRRVEIRRAS